jgi:predicted nucleic acid-binding protein
MPANAKTPKVLDSFALLAFLNREPGFEKVRTLLRTAETASEPLLMNEINVGEVFYIIAKTRSLERAEDLLHRLETLPITPGVNQGTHEPGPDSALVIGRVVGAQVAIVAGLVVGVVRRQ